MGKRVKARLIVNFVNCCAGLWAVINTAGVCLKGKLEQQDSSQWETMVKVNLFGMLRAARTFMPLLKTKKGTYTRILYPYR